MANSAKGRYVALLRGVNVGGNNKIAMKGLAALFSDCNCHNVETYIQSGNVVFSADAKAAAQAKKAICESIQKQFGFQTHIILRTESDLKRINGLNPYCKPDIPVETLHVVFLAETPRPDRVALLDPDRSPPDQFTVLDSEIYLRMPNGMGRTKLTNAYFDSKLQTISTARNWRTLQKLLQMLRGTID